MSRPSITRLCAAIVGLALFAGCSAENQTLEIQSLSGESDESSAPANNRGQDGRREDEAKPAETADDTPLRRPANPISSIPEAEQQKIYLAYVRALAAAKKDPEWRRLEEKIEQDSGATLFEVQEFAAEQEKINQRFIQEQVLDQFSITDAQLQAIIAKRRGDRQSGRTSGE